MWHALVLFSAFHLLLVESFIEPTFDAIEQCPADNWGMPNQSRRPYRTDYATTLQSKCHHQFTKSTVPMSSAVPNATVSYYPNLAAFNNFQGSDWVPENHGLFKPGAPWGKKLEAMSIRKESMKAAFCDVEQEDGSTWTVTRIGPFKTTVRE